MEVFCGWLFHISEANPNKCKELSLLLIRELGQSDHVDIILMAQCCLIKSLILLDEVKMAIERFHKALNLAQINSSFDLGEDLINIIFEGLNKPNFLPEETHILILRDIVYFYNHFNKFEKSISIMVHIANIFSKFRAFSSAYRILNEAEAIATEERIFEKLADVHCQAGLVAYCENDFEFASRAFENAFQKYEKLNMIISQKLYINLATSYMQLKRFNKSIVIYEKILKESPADSIVQVIYLNLVVCYRQCNNLEEAMKNYNKINQKYFEEVVDSSAKIEFYIISANTFFKSKSYGKSLNFLLRAIESMEVELKDIYRLHYRRGYREKYFPRVQELLVLLTNPKIICQLNFEKVLQIILFTKMNAFSDWLSINDWVNYVQSERCTNTEKENLLTVFKKLMSQGMPIIYGYNEKYDDPFEDYGMKENSDQQNFQSFSRLWNEFNVVINELLNKYSFEAPYKDASSEVIFNQIIEKISNSDMFLIFSYLTRDSIIFLYSHGKKFNRFDVPIEYYIHLSDTLAKYQMKDGTRKEFMDALQESITIYKQYFYELVNDIKEASHPNLVIINKSYLKLFPIQPILYNDKFIRNLISNGVLSISSVPILSQSNYKEFFPKSYLGIFEPFNELPLLEEELKLSERFNAFKKVTRINFASDNENENLKSAEFIHIATHGFPISKFTDPMFSSISGPLSKNSFSLEKIQKEFNKYNYKIVFLSMCDSSDQTNNNLFKKFRTDESISFPSLMLLNRQSIIISINWPILDIIPYIFTYCFLEELHKTNVVVTAFNKAQIKLYNMTIKEILNVLDCISDENLKEQKKNMFRSLEKNNCPFKHPYIFGAFTLSTLFR